MNMSENREREPPSIGVCSMAANGTIVLRLHARSDGKIAEACGNAIARRSVFG
jgi:hypothetical protein